jgi:hypothetical protein
MWGSNYQIQTGVIDSGGGTIGSTNFRIQPGSIGQSATIVGISTSPNYTVQGGFIPASEAEGEPNPPTPPGAIPEFPTKFIVFVVGILALGAYFGIKIWKTKFKTKSTKI